MQPRKDRNETDARLVDYSGTVVLMAHTGTGATRFIHRATSRMSVLPALDLKAAVQGLRHVQAYDVLRLETYRKKENLTERIRLSRLGSAMALRFDDVGYFNRVYCADETVFERLPEIEDRYRGGPHGCELVGPPSADLDGGSRVISRSGWEPASRFVWLYAPDVNALAPPPQAAFDIRPPEPRHRMQFLLAYLQAFEAQEDRIPSALCNMRHLFDRPELDFFMASHGDRLAGVGMMMRRDNAALLCAGAALPDFREKGCHSALLTARIRLAAEYGCEEIYSWAILGGQSQANLEKAGLAPVGVTTAWRFTPEPER